MNASTSALMYLTSYISILQPILPLTSHSLNHIPPFSPHGFAYAGFPCSDNPAVFFPPVEARYFHQPMSHLTSSKVDLSLPSSASWLRYIIRSHFVVAVPLLFSCTPPQQESLSVYYNARDFMFKNLFLAKCIPCKSTRSKEVKTKARKISLIPLRSAEQLKTFSPFVSHACCNWPKVGKLDAMGGGRRIKSSFFSIFLGDTNSVFFSLRYWCWVSVIYLRMLLYTRTMDGRTFFLEQCSYLLRKGLCSHLYRLFGKGGEIFTQAKLSKNGRGCKKRGVIQIHVFIEPRDRGRKCVVKL